MSVAITWPELDVEEVDIVYFDFASALDVGDAISLVSVSCELLRGVDPLPDLVRVGLPVVEGLLVWQRVKGQAAGAIYHLRCVITPVSGLKKTLAANLPVKRF